MPLFRSSAVLPVARSSRAGAHIRQSVLAGALLLLIAGLATPAAAQNASNSVVQRAPASSTSQVDWLSWGNVVAVLLLVGGGGYALYLRRQNPAARAHALFKPMGQFSLGQSQQLRLVACGGEVLLLGVTAQDVTLIKTYERDAFAGHPALVEADEIEQNGADTATTASGNVAWPAGFSDVLARFARQHPSA